MIKLNKSSNRILINTSSGYSLYLPKEITHIEALGNYSKIYLIRSTKPLIIHNSLCEIEKELSPGLFFRCHKSYIVNVAHIAEIKCSNHNKAILVSNIEVPVSRRKRKNLLKQL